MGSHQIPSHAVIVHSVLLIFKFRRFFQHGIIPGNKPFEAFLEGQMSKDKPTPLLAIKTPILWMRRPVIFFTHSHLFLYSIYSLQVQLQVISLSHPQQFVKKCCFFFHV